MNRPEPVGDGADALSMSKARDEPTLHDGEDGALSLHRSVGRWIQDASHLPVALGTAVTVVDARTFLVAGTGAHPRGEMLR